MRYRDRTGKCETDDQGTQKNKVEFSLAGPCVILSHGVRPSLRPLLATHNGISGCSPTGDACSAVMRPVVSPLPDLMLIAPDRGAGFRAKDAVHLDGIIAKAGQRGLHLPPFGVAHRWFIRQFARSPCPR